MKIKIHAAGLSLICETGDKPIYKESTVTHHIRRLLNERDGANAWVRWWPNKIGLTDCKQGVKCNRGPCKGEAYWHERYQIESASKAFNNGKVFYQWVK